jgi:F-type H+-transporting ATPase subunit b
MPQINQLLLVYQSQWFWLALVLAAIYFGIGRGMVPRIERVVEDRNAKIAGDLAAAERARAGADDAEERARQADAAARAAAHEVTAVAKAKAAKDAEGRLAKADAGLAEKLAVAETALGKARGAALANLEAVAAEAAQDIVAKVSGASVTAAKAKTAVKAVFANA